MRRRIGWMLRGLGCWLVLSMSPLRLPAQPSGQGAALYGVTFYDRTVITLDTNTGAGTVMTNLGTSPRDLATYNGMLYVYGPAGQSVKLVRIDPWTGSVLATTTFTNEISGGEGAMDFRMDGVVFATTSSSSTGTLYRLEVTASNVSNITVEGGLNPGFDGLAFDSHGVLFGLSQNRGGSFGLYVVNQTNGATTLVGELGVFFPVNGGAVAGLAFAPSGELYAALGNPVESNLYRLDPSSGAATLIGPVGLPGVSGIRFLNPAPGPLGVENTGTGLRIFWPHARGGILEAAASVEGPWTNAAWVITTNGAEASALAPPNAGEGYFRLRR